MRWSGVQGIVLDQLAPSWSKVLLHEGKTQQDDNQLGQVGPTWAYWDHLGPFWSRTPCATVFHALLIGVCSSYLKECRGIHFGDEAAA